MFSMKVLNFKSISKLFDKKLFFDSKLNNFKIKINCNDLITKRLSHQELEVFKDFDNFNDLNEEKLNNILTEKKNFLFKYYLGNRNFTNLTVDNFKSIIENEEDKKNVASILKMYELQKYDSGLVPSNLTTENMLHLLKNDDSFQKKQNYFIFLARKEINKIVLKDVNNVKKIFTTQKIKSKFVGCPERTGFYYSKDGMPYYGKWKNTFFLGLNKNDFRKPGMERARTSILFGQKIVFDFDFESQMNEAEYNSTCVQVIESYSHNFTLKDPFALYFCNLKNLKLKNLLFDRLNLFDSPKFLNCTEKSYLDIFEKEKLVYLTPDSNKTLKTFDYDKIYIIGALTDKYHSNHSSLEKSIKEKIPSYRLPLTSYLFLKGSKNLNINHVFKIMCDLKNGNDWATSLKKNVPQRKQKSDEEVHEQQRIKLEKYQKQLMLKKIIDRKQRYLR